MILLKHSLLMLRCRASFCGVLYRLLPGRYFISIVSLLLLGAAASPAQVVINEVMAANGDAVWDFSTENQPSWVELHNTGNNVVDLSGFFLSDDPSDIRKWRVPNQVSIPARGHLMVWCDNRNLPMYTGFGLSATGEELILSGPSGILIDRLKYPPQHLNVSYGRINDGAALWAYFPKATAGEPNKGPSAVRVAAPPKLSVPAGPASPGLLVELSTPQAGSVIRYTTDGSEPNEFAAVYAKPISLTRTTTIKARVYANGFIPGPTETHSYLIHGRGMVLPVISLSTRPDYLWDEYTGIHVEGSNGIPGNCTDNRNWNQDWERHTVMEYFDESGKRKVVQDVDMRIGGACSRTLPQKSLVIKARSKYGSDKIPFGFFPNRTVEEVGGFILRNSGNDFNVTQFRDAFAQALAAQQLDLDYLDYRPVVVYLNGEYWGIMNVQEKADGDYFRDNAGLEPEETDLLEVVPSDFGARAVSGTTEAWESYIRTLESMNRSTSEAFRFIGDHIDVDEYINYAVTEIYLANTDWPGNNVRFWRPRRPGGKFRWVLWDLDFSFALFEGFSNATHPTLHFATDPSQGGWPNPAISTLHLRLLLDNPMFRLRFASRMITAMEETFHPDRVNDLLDEFTSRIAAEMPYHKSRWGGAIQDWYWELDRMRRFASDRYAFMKIYVRDFFGYSESAMLTVASARTEQGSFRLNGVWCDQAQFTGMLIPGIPFRLEPHPAPGYRFSKWTISGREVDTLDILPSDALWKYSDNGQLPAADWMMPGFADQSWAAGPAELGYGDGDERTVVSFGPQVDDKYPTTWFRSSFTLDDTTGVGRLIGSLKYDDGVVIYLNGYEVLRANMPAGEITAQTFALTLAQEDLVHQLEFPPEFLRPGVNVIAAEVHQVSAVSSDISFRLELTALRIGKTSVITSEEKALELERVSATDVVLHFAEDTRDFSGLVINELSADNSDKSVVAAEDWIELYNNSADTLDLDGLMITDDPAEPSRMVIRSGVVPLKITPGGFLVLVADGRNMAGPLHLPFRLSSGGETVGMYTTSGQVVEPLDIFEYDDQSPDASWARIPDGIGAFVQTSATTPGARNVLAVVVEEPTNSKSSVYPNPFKNMFRFTEPTDEWELRSPIGQRIDCQTDALGWVHVPDLPAGLYVVRIRINGTWKFVRLVRQ